MLKESLVNITCKKWKNNLINRGKYLRSVFKIVVTNRHNLNC